MTPFFLKVLLAFPVCVCAGALQVERAQAATQTRRRNRRGQARNHARESLATTAGSAGAASPPPPPPADPGLRIIARQSYRPALLAIPAGSGSPVVLASAAERNDPAAPIPGARSAQAAAAALQAALLKQRRNVATAIATAEAPLSGALPLPTGAEVGAEAGAEAASQPKLKLTRRRRRRKVPDPDAVSARAAAFLRPQVQKPPSFLSSLFVSLAPRTLLHFACLCFSISICFLSACSCALSLSLFFSNPPLFLSRDMFFCFLFFFAQSTTRPRWT